MADHAGVVLMKSAGDAGDCAVLEACEATFNIELSTDEAQALRTVGDLYSVIRWKCQRESLGPSTASIAGSYRALRAHLAAAGVGRPIRPTSALEAVLGPDPRLAWARLRRQFGRGLPPLELSDGQLLVTAMLLALGLAGGVFGGLWVSDAVRNPWLGAVTGLSVLGLAILGVMAYGLAMARSIPVGLRTMADLARIVASLGEPRRPLRQGPALWEALEDIIRRDGGFEGKVTRDVAVELSQKASAR